MEPIIIVSKEPGASLGMATAIAAGLKSTGKIQAYDVAEKVAGVALTPFPPMADCVKDQGGFDKYVEGIVAKFDSHGYKQYVEAAPTPELSAEEVESLSPEAAIELERKRAAWDAAHAFDVTSEIPLPGQPKISEAKQAK